MIIKDHPNRNKVLKDIDSLIEEYPNSANLIIAREAVDVNNTHKAIILLMLSKDIISIEVCLDIATKLDEC